MNKEIRRIYNREIREEIISHWGLSESETIELDGFESFIYSANFNARKAVLKISHTDRRSIEHLKGEIDFTRYLHSRQLNVPEIFEGKSGELITTAKAERGMFTGVLYSFLEGEPVTKEKWNNELWEKIGELLGDLHRVTKEYTLNSGRRPDIFE